MAQITFYFITLKSRRELSTIQTYLRVSTIQELCYYMGDKVFYMALIFPFVIQDDAPHLTATRVFVVKKCIDILQMMWMGVGMETAEMAHILWVTFLRVKVDSLSAGMHQIACAVS